MTLPPSRPDLRVTTVSLTVEAMPGGRYRLSTPHARGWAATVSNQNELARALAESFTEVSVASYARAKGHAYDLDALTERVHGDALAHTPRVRAAEDGRLVTGSTRRMRRKTHHPADWSKLEDGRWQSPSGRAYRADTKQVQYVIRARLERGLTI